MNKYIVGICDDDKIFCSTFEDFIYKYFKSRMKTVDIYVWYNGSSLINDISKLETIHILFLDIELNTMHGVDIGRHIRNNLKNNLMQIIYISCRTEYALELFETHPFDFLRKPINFDYCSSMLDSLLCVEDKNNRCYCFKVNGTIYRVPYTEIVYMESDNKHLVLKLIKGESYRFIGRLKEERKYFDEDYMLASKSCIVNMKYIKVYKSNYVEMYGGEIKGISKSCRKGAREAFCRFIESECI